MGRKWYFLREVYFDPGVRLTQLGGVYTWKGGTGDRSYGFCIQSPGTGEVPGGGTSLDRKKELGENADLAPADQGIEPAGYARVWPEHLWR